MNANFICINYYHKKIFRSRRQAIVTGADGLFLSSDNTSVITTDNAKQVIIAHNSGGGGAGTSPILKGFLLC